MKEGEVIESGMLTRQIEKAQRKVESHNFDIRKQLLLFDDVANDQRKVIYQQRTEILGTEDLSRGDPRHAGRCDGHADRPVHAQAGGPPRTGIWTACARRLQRDFNVSVDPKAWLRAEPELEEAALRERVLKAVMPTPTRPRWRAPARRSCATSRSDVMLRTLDHHWREHLAAMDYLRQGIHLRGYAQKDYRFEFKREAFELFSAMLDRVKFETVSLMAKIEVRTQEEIEREEEERRERLMRALQAQHAGGAALPVLERAGAAAAPGAMPGLAGAGRRPPSRPRAVRARGPQGRPQRALPVRLGQEVQALSRRALEAKPRHRPANASWWWPRRSTMRRARC